MAEPTATQRRVTRLAPSPTGALHLGNARTFVVNWALARQKGWEIAFRIDDLDTPRNKERADLQAIEDLSWLGLDWDSEPLYQRADLQPYHDAIAQLQEQGRVYACTCTRREIESAQSAPHGDDHELRYPGTCRPTHTAQPTPSRDSPSSKRDDFALRVIVPDELTTFIDAYLGEQTVNVQQEVGDFVIQSKAQLPSYQLATVIDDARQGVTDVVRGDDLIRSTGRQMMLYRFLGEHLAVHLANVQPRYWHLPLVIGEDGRRLAKRHGDMRIAFYRENGVPPERIIGLLAKWSGLLADRKTLSATEFADGFDIGALPNQPAVFTEEDHAWLLS